MILMIGYRRGEDCVAEIAGIITGTTHLFIVYVGYYSIHSGRSVQ